MVVKENPDKKNNGVRCIYFGLEISFSCKFDPKNRNCQFQLKSGTSSYTKNSIVMFTVSVFERTYPFYGKFVSNNQNCLLKLKFGT